MLKGQNLGGLNQNRTKTRQDIFETDLTKTGQKLDRANPRQTKTQAEQHQDKIYYIQTKPKQEKT